MTHTPSREYITERMEVSKAVAQRLKKSPTTRLKRKERQFFASRSYQHRSEMFWSLKVAVEEELGSEFLNGRVVQTTKRTYASRAKNPKARKLRSATISLILNPILTAP